MNHKGKYNISCCSNLVLLGRAYPTWVTFSVFVILEPLESTPDFLSYRYDAFYEWSRNFVGYWHIQIRASLVSIGTRLQAGGAGFNSQPAQWCDTSSSPPRPDRLWGPPSLPIQWIPGALIPRIERPGREADHSSPSSAEVKSAWKYTSTAPTWLCGVVIN
jgi:hypothetical protein